MRDTTAGADTVSVYGEGLPETAAACRVALRHATRKYADRSHAEGHYGRFACRLADLGDLGTVRVIGA